MPRRLDRLRNASGGTPTASFSCRMQKVMQNNCAVFRSAILQKPQAEPRGLQRGRRRSRYRPHR